MTNDNGFSDKLKAGVNKAKGEVKDQVGNATEISPFKLKVNSIKLKVPYKKKLVKQKIVTLIIDNNKTVALFS